MRDDEKIDRLKRNVKELEARYPGWRYKAGRTVLSADDFIRLLGTDKKFRQKMLDNIDALSIELLSRQVK